MSMQIHDRRDQLIYALAGIQATIWVGLFSVGFWEGSAFWIKCFWTSMALATIAISGQFLSVIACYYYPKAIEDSNLLHGDKKSTEFFWKCVWNLHWKWFSMGIATSIFATLSRFMG